MFFAFLYSCSPVKFVPEDKYLLNDVDVQIDNPDINKEEVKSYVRQKENYRILGFAKFHLWLYNLSSKEKENGWLKRIGEAPQIYDQGLTFQSVGQIEQYLDNEGYFKAVIEPEVKFKEQKQKANVLYRIKTGEQYTIRKINYH
ncbi:MAG TPA: POTRA domain-containing protein, partial [Prolixibacteraceae bacterium]|nr:POTRA domain-containing protein [Prolixibacteraceae bacterium]